MHKEAVLILIKKLKLILLEVIEYLINHKISQNKKSLFLVWIEKK